MKPEPGQAGTAALWFVCCRCGSARSGNGHRDESQYLEHIPGETTVLSLELVSQVHCLGFRILVNLCQACTPEKNDELVYICEVWAFPCLWFKLRVINFAFKNP